ncbi:unnamed protein product [Sphagnum balticum]
MVPGEDVALAFGDDVVEEEIGLGAVVAEEDYFALFHGFGDEAFVQFCFEVLVGVNSPIIVGSNWRGVYLCRCP